MCPELKKSTIKTLFETFRHCSVIRGGSLGSIEPSDPERGIKHVGFDKSGCKIVENGIVEAHKVFPNPPAKILDPPQRR